MENRAYYVLYSNTSRNGMTGLRPAVGWMTEAQIIMSAQNEFMRQGSSLEEFAGMQAIEDVDGNITYPRELTSDEVITLCAEKLSDDGRLFEIFLDANGANDFIDAAKRYDMGFDAQVVVDNF